MKKAELVLSHVVPGLKECHSGGKLVGGDCIVYPG